MKRPFLYIVYSVCCLMGQKAVAEKPYKLQVDTLIAAHKQQFDSISTQANVKYNQVGRFHRKLFGENYREEWATKTGLPVIHISQFQGGVQPVKQGGGMQTVSLRLVDKTGKEWVIRSVNKNTDALLPEELQETFARDFLDDANSAQHPYSALMIPPLADAVNVPHTNPIIGIIAPDTALGSYNDLFAYTLCLVEEREPLGDSDNTLKMLDKLNNDNDDVYKAKTFIRARLLDVLVSDWDRHEDQWRWLDTKEGKNKDYLPIPRDRDQALRVTEGFFPYIASRSWLLPTLQGFGPIIKSPKYSFFKSDFLDAHPKAQFSYDEWMEITHDFVSKMTDSVLEASLERLPKEIYTIRHDTLLTQLKARRDDIPRAAASYYRFMNHIVDIKLSDKNEWVSIKDTSDGAIAVLVQKINKEGERKDKLMEKIYPATDTREIRIYLGDGDDSVWINNQHSHTKLRLIGGNDPKYYHLQSSQRKVPVYDHGTQTTFTGHTAKFRKHLSTDSSITAFVPVNRYDVWMPLVTGGYNADDGLMLGGGFKYTHQQGFRKTPFTHQQELLVSGAFATGAFKVKYRGIWTEWVGKADLLLYADLYAPNNTQNFFGLGNASVYDKAHGMRYYRTRFNLYEAHAALQWKTSENLAIRVGPSFQAYYFDPDDNQGRFIQHTEQLHTYDSLTIDQNKFFTGIRATVIHDHRNLPLLTTKGSYFEMALQGSTGLNSYSKSFLQTQAAFALYKSIGILTFANRIGGGATWGETTFYQSLFLGGQENLWGYRQYRFAGKHLFFNNFELRLKLAQIGSYIMPGQLGLTGFYDIGKVWAEGLNDNKVHQGVGGGIYYAPARITLFQFVLGHGSEGWYPYFTMGFRF